MLESAHPQLEILDYAVRILGWPTLLGIVIWCVRKWDAGQREFKALSETTKAAAAGVAKVQEQVTTLQTNHLAHLQTGIEEVSKTNAEAVTVLKEIREKIAEANQNTALLLDRVPR